MKYAELERLLRKSGCYPLGDGTNHEKWVNPATGVVFGIGRHSQQEVSSGVLHSVLKKAGLKK